MHMWLLRYVRHIVTRFAVLVCLVSAGLAGALRPLGAADSDLNTLLKGVEQRYNHAKTLEVQFTESYSVQGRARKSESGDLTLRKPGRMFWNYTAPAGKFFLSDGKDVYLYTPETHQVQKTKLKASDDMRAPLAFLLGKLDFGKEFRDFSLKAEGGNFVIAAKAKTDQLQYDKIEMLITPDYEIRRLVVNGQDQSVLTFQFENEKLNPAVNEALFKFQTPQGATVVDEGGA
ncbi:MAG TPA: outer membrane lipoprotein chaperone LolA [Bryobacteraceae bacterium]|nr:outer membrane lipoprotein chaperone LolA [Bryobacteraceae bacterium]